MTETRDEDEILCYANWEVRSSEKRGPTTAAVTKINYRYIIRVDTHQLGLQLIHQ